MATTEPSNKKGKLPGHGTILRGLLIVGGIYVSFVAFGYFQELVYQTPANKPPQERFRFPAFLVAALCLGNLGLSASLLWLFPETTLPKINSSGVRDGKAVVSSPILHFWRQFLNIPKEGMEDIILSSITYSVSMFCTNVALKHVNYPTQVLVKSAKSVPVILGGLVFFGKRYPAFDYVTVALVTVALILFNLSRAYSSGHVKETPQTAFGLGLLGLSLFCDSLTGPRQDRLLARISITPLHLMALTNVFGACVAAGISVFLEGIAPLQFLVGNPSALCPVALFCFSASLGQLFIFWALSEFGSLQLTLITTTRKFFTVVFSVVAFGHNVSIVQWSCVLIIFGALIMQAVFKHRLRSRKASEVALMTKSVEAGVELIHAREPTATTLSDNNVSVSFNETKLNDTADVTQKRLAGESATLKKRKGAKKMRKSD